MNKTALKKYAQLIVRRGANVQKGQPVRITAELDQPEFVQLLVEESYRAGASEVILEWNHTPLTKAHARWQSFKTLSRTEDWEIARMAHYEKTLPAHIYLESADPDGLRGIREPKFSKAMQARRGAIKPYRDRMENKFQWCIAAVPGEAWAKKLYPKLTRHQAVERLWKDILFTARADGDPMAAWDAHNADLRARCEHLNALDLRELRYRSANGTDLRVGLLPNAEFHGGSDVTQSGTVYNCNIPSEEVFTTPRAGAADGVVYSTKPLSFMGQIIDGFSVRFEHGSVTEVKAAQNEELLKTLIATDEGAARLGECALVPVDSPISESGLLFYSTLFDENASCHLALGAGFNEVVRDYEKYTDEELTAMGINDSLVHMDFMIGSDTLDIDGVTAEGRTVPLFRAGRWAF